MSCIKSNKCAWKIKYREQRCSLVCGINWVERICRVKHIVVSRSANMHFSDLYKTFIIFAWVLFECLVMTCTFFTRPYSTFEFNHRWLYGKCELVKTKMLWENNKCEQLSYVKIVCTSKTCLALNSKLLFDHSPNEHA